MNRSKLRAGTAGFVLCSIVIVALTGCPPYSREPQYGGAYYGPSGQGDGGYMEIQADSDFYEPLSPYGRWEVVGSFGRCWIPGGVGADWSPYSNGYWQRTDAGWYWASDEPWGWATYHYGRWDSSPQYGWFWVPQTQWAPAWVSWREGGGYVGWAPLGPSGRPVADVRRRGATSDGYVFVEERRFLDPVRPTTIVVNNTVVSRTVLNRGPGAAEIERASGRTMPAVPVRQLRSREEAKVVGRHPAPTPTRQQAAPTPVRERAVTAPPAREPQPRQVEQKAVPAPVRYQAENAPPVREAQPRQVEQKAAPAPVRYQTENARPARESQPPAVTNEVHQAAGQSQAAKLDGEKRAQQEKARENVRPPPAAVAAKPENRPQASHETQQIPPQVEHEIAPAAKHEVQPQASHETRQTPPQAKHEVAPAAKHAAQPQAKQENKPAATKEPSDQKPGKDEKQD